MNEDSYSDIRPYNDDEIPAALERIVNDPFFVPAVNFAFPDADMERIREVVRTCKTVDQMQERVMFSIIKRIIEATIDNFTSTGIERVEKDKGYLYISNHRDITLDSLLLQYTLFTNGLSTTATTLGDNLLRSQFIIDICRINRAVRVIRKTDDISPREFLQNSQHLAEYIRWYISQGKSMWISQRNGRTKDGIDATDQGVLKMVSLSGPSDFIENLSELNIAPIAISYQYEPCDIKKTIETVVNMTGGTYQKGKNEDVNSILYGIVNTVAFKNIYLRTVLTASVRLIYTVVHKPESGPYLRALGENTAALKIAVKLTESTAVVTVCVKTCSIPTCARAANTFIKIKAGNDKIPLSYEGKLVVPITRAALT